MGRSLTLARKRALPWHYKVYRFVVSCIGYLVYLFAKFARFVKNVILLRKPLSRTIIPKGHSLYLFNANTGQVTDLDRYERDENGEVIRKKKEIKLTKGCFAIVALNVKNALRKARKINKLSGYGWSEKQIKYRRQEETTS